MSQADGTADPRTRAGRVALIGRPNVGKSTLFNALLREPIAITSRHAQTTRTQVRGILTEDLTQYVLLDTPGIHSARSELGRRMNETTKAAIHDSDVVVWVIDISPAGRVGLDPGRDSIVTAELGARRAILAINKIDRLGEMTPLLPVLQQLGKMEAFAAIVPVSARAEDGTLRLLREIRALLPEQPWLFEPDTLSDQPTRFFAAEFVREQVLKHSWHEVPHGVAVVVDRFEETPRRTAIDMTIHVVREAHKKILIGEGGQMVKRIGSEARARIEGLVSGKVDLRLWVRVSAGWTEDPTQLREFGFSKDGGA